jgi:CDP-diacylglycerol--serine O-phosphatidyltransferase
MRINHAKNKGTSDDFLIVRLIPNIFTTVGMCIGLTGIRFAIESDWESAVICVLIAAFFDLVDGLTARMLRATSKMGAELDSLSDAVSFGVTPTIILYLWILSISNFSDSYLQGWYWVPFIFYASCCVLRLARFNIASREMNKEDPMHPISYFVGVPSPAGAIVLLSPIILAVNLKRFGIDQPECMNPLYISTWVMLVSFLMVSRIPTISLKSIKYRISNRKVIFVLIAVILGAAIIIREQWLSLALAIVLYLISIPIFSIYLKRISSK